MAACRVRARVLVVVDPYREAKELDQGSVRPVQTDRVELLAVSPVCQSVFPCMSPLL